ncbi:hypothetical protein GW860_07345 [bacterium]|nr:hypothetical protein [bacterium]
MKKEISFLPLKDLPELFFQKALEDPDVVLNQEKLLSKRHSAPYDLQWTGQYSPALGPRALDAFKEPRIEGNLHLLAEF